MKLAILSNVNLEPLKAHLQKADAAGVHFSAYGQHLIELLDQRSTIHQQEGLEALFLHLDAEELLKDDFFGLPRPDSAEARLKEVLDALQAFCERRAQVNVIISTLSFPPFSCLTHLDANSQHSPSAVEQQLNRQLRDFASRRHNVFLLDFARLQRLHGANAFCDDKYWYLGRIKYTHAGFRALAEELNGLWCAINGKTRKVLVLDLDNTLWGGVLGEDGPGGLQLSEDGLGKAYRDFQKAIKGLKSLGVLLAINSKNNESDVREFFANSPMMVLRYEDFVSRKVNWNNKVENLREIAEELNLGTDSFVMIDDSAAERALVRQYVPEVATPEFPKDPAQLKRWFLSDVVYRYFPKVALTTEDLKKSEQYERNIKRRELGAGLNLKEFIGGLKIRLAVKKNEPQTLQRIAQLTQKTNQFNLTTLRLSLADLEHRLKSGNFNIYGLEYEDRFGPEGLIGVCLVERKESAAKVENFLLSCRVLGRNVEYSFLLRVLRDLQLAGAARLTAEFIPSPKNSVAREFYPQAGLTPLANGRFEGDVAKLIDHLERNYAD